MRKIVFLKKLFNKLKEFIKFDGREKSGYVLCNYTESCFIQKYLAMEIIIPEERDYISRSFGYCSLKREFTNRVYKQAIEKQLHVIRVHSHPPEINRFSPIDERTHKAFAKEFFIKVEGMEIGSMVFSSDLKTIDAWYYDKKKEEFIRFDKIIVLGKKSAEFYFPGDLETINIPEDRNYLAYGSEGMKILNKLDVGVVGGGGTGGPTSEQLARLKIRRLFVCDDDEISWHNLNRLQGAGYKDIGKKKVYFYQEYLNNIFKNEDDKTEIIPLACNFYDPEVQKIFSGLDVIFGCSDSGVRISLNSLATAHLIPYFDLGVTIHVEKKKIKFMGGQVFNVIPGNHVCLNCGSNFRDLFYEYLSKKDLEDEKKMKYINIPIKNPNVYHLNTTLVGMGISEFLKYVLKLNNNFNFKLFYNGITNKLDPTSFKYRGCLRCKDCLGQGNKIGFLVPENYLEESEIPEIEEELNSDVKESQVSNEKRTD